RPRAGAEGPGGARTAVPAVVFGRLSGTVPRVRGTPGGRARAHAPGTDRPALGRPQRPAPAGRTTAGQLNTEPHVSRAGRVHQAPGGTEESYPWPFRGGRCRAATPAAAGRSGRPAPRRW